MLTKLKSRRGETLIEVFVATIVLVVGALSATRLFAVATINNQLTKERVIATNLAREGLEAVRTIRDTNWLRFAGERRTCWNNLDLSECNDSDLNGVPDTVIGHRQNYIVKFDTSSYRWELDATGLSERLDITDGVDAEDEKYRLQVTDDLYNHSGVVADNTVYYREIYTEYLNDDQTQDASTDESANVLRVTAKVQWYDRGKISNVTLTTILTDYLNRKNHL